MKPLTMEYGTKVIWIHHPLKEKTNYLEYVLNDAAQEETKKILEKFGFPWYIAGFNNGMTDVFVEISFPYDTSDELINRICNEIIKTLRRKKYVEK